MNNEKEDLRVPDPVEWSSFMPRVLTLTALLLTLPMAAHAFDGRRAGFLLGFGLGPIYQSVEQEWLIAGESSSRDDSDSAFGTTIQFGYGLTDRLVLGWVWGLGSDTDDDETKLLGTSVTRGSTSFKINGFGAAYFFNQRAPSPFVEAVIGTARWDDGGDNAFDGPGLAASIGYEVRKNWMVKGTFGWGTPNAEATVGAQEVEAEVTGLIAVFSAGYLWY